MTDTKDRLQLARKEAGYEDASSAARAMGVPITTYLAHENGEKGLSRAGPRYARFFRVSLDWLVTGQGEMKLRPGGYAPRPPIMMMGRVGAGGRVGPIDGDEPADDIDWPDPEFIGALTVDGVSQEPRYLHGEVVLYDRRPRQPTDLLNRYAVVDCLDGRRLLKMLKRPQARTPKADVWRLESLNAEPEETQILAAFELWPRPKR